MKNTSFLLLLIITSLIINQDSVKGSIHHDIIPLNFRYVHTSRYDLGDQVHVEFNDTLMPDNQVYGPDDEVWFSFTVDVAEFRFDPQQDYDRSQAYYWYFAGKNEYSVYNETRFQGILNVYLDEIDFGLSNVLRFSGEVNTTQDLLQVYITTGWHLLTVFAAEYVSNPTRTTMFWQTSKDEKWFYVSADTSIEPPARETSTDVVTVKANPVISSEWYPAFDWEFINIWPRAERTEGTPFNQEINQEGQVAHVETNFNVTTGSLLLDTINTTGTPEVVYYDPAHMGIGTIFWWANDGPVTSNPQTSFELNKGENYVYFAAVGFRVYYSYFYQIIITPRADIDSKEFIIFNNIITDNSLFAFGSFVISIAFFGVIIFIHKKKKDK